MLQEVFSLLETAIFLRIERLIALDLPVALVDRLNSHSERLHHAIDDLTSLPVHGQMLEKAFYFLHRQDLSQPKSRATGDELFVVAGAHLKADGLKVREEN